MSEQRVFRWRSWLAVFLVAVATVAALGTFKYRQIQAGIAFAESFPESSETVVVATAREATFRRTETAIGEVVPVRALDVIAELPGRITEVGFEPGARVEAGQLLARLDTREEQANLAAVEAEAELARLTVARNESLSKQSMVSRQTADQARADERVALAEAERLRVVIDKKTLRAPFAGRAGLHEWQIGHYVAAGTVVTRLVGLDAGLWVDFSLPQDQAVSDVAATVTVHPPGGGPSVEARIIAREPQVNALSRMLTFRALANVSDETSLVPGALARVDVAVGPESKAIRVPATAVRRDAFGTHVFVLEAAEPEADGPLRARRRAVEVTAIVGETAYLASGLEADQTVAGDGAFKVRDGMLVFPSEDADALAQDVSTGTP